MRGPQGRGYRSGISDIIGDPLHLWLSIFL
jgi:hypothetical protein